jgi:hypothetical protein
MDQKIAGSAEGPVAGLTDVAAIVALWQGSTEGGRWRK